MEETSSHERQANLHCTALECNICLTSPTNPVATSCGHLFCWPCLYRWLQDQFAGPCPVCRATVRKDINITPIYGSHEEGSKDAGRYSELEGAPSEGLIPPRPNPSSPSNAISLDTMSGQVISIDATADQIINGSLLAVNTLLELNDHNVIAQRELHLALEAERAHVNALKSERRRLMASVIDLIRINHNFEARERAQRQREQTQAFLNSMRVHYAWHDLP